MSKLLIADDDMTMRFLIESALEEIEDKGVEFFSADNGGTALEIITREKPELVILDIIIPVITGLEICNTIKNNLKINKVFIILLTGRGERFTRDKAKEAGADLFMTKPFNPDILLSTAKTVYNF